MPDGKEDSFIDNFKQLIQGGYILLFMFGGTICLMASSSLIASFFTENPAKIALLAKILDTTIGFMFGAFTTVWNNQHFKDSKNGNGKEQVIEKIEKKE